MPITPTYPGLYIEEIPSSTHTIVAAPTSVTVFVGYTHPFKTVTFNQPMEIFGFSDYERLFGGFFGSTAFDAQSNLFGSVAQAVNQFFLNGGGDAFVIGLLPSKEGVPITQPGTATIGPLTFTAREITDEMHQILITVSNLMPASSPPSSPPSDDTCDVTISFGPPAGSKLQGYGVTVETYRQVSLYQTSPITGKTNPNFIETVIGNAASPVSALVTVAADPSAGFLQATPSGGTLVSSILSKSDLIFQASDFTNNVFVQNSPLDKMTSIFNLMVIPGVIGSVIASATAFCERKRAFLIMDPPQDNSADGTGTPAPPAKNTGTISQTLPTIEETMEGKNAPIETIPLSQNSALYFPYLECNDPLTGLPINPCTNQPYEIPPSGTVAGIFASTDSSRGVWKAPAGLATILINITDVVNRGQMNDQQQGVLNPLGINCIRNFPGIGPVVFGARTSVAGNVAFQQWKYVPVRRMALFLEQTLYANLGWVVFEPNADPLWTAIRGSINSFMLGLFKQGAFQGNTPSDAFQVKCDSQTTTQDDIDNGIVNIVVAFAPLVPAEFVIIQIAQIAGQTQTS
jgi:hypothetical protein